MKLEEISDLWEDDAKIDRTELGNEATKIPQLHNKYFKIFSKERLILKKLVEDRKQFKLLKFEYYMGTLDEETLKERNWEPNPRKILRSDIDMYIDGDKEYIDLNLKIAYQQEKIDFLESIIRSLNSRGYEISSAIKWEFFKVGA